MSPTNASRPDRAELSPSLDESTRRLRVMEVRAVADEVVKFRLSAVDGQPLPGWSAGAHVDLILPNGLERQYSLCGSPEDRFVWEVAVLREDSGRGGSKYLHDEISEGDVIDARGPRNHFGLIEAPRYIFLAGGIGVTPILAMLEKARSTSASWNVIYGGRTLSSMAFRDEILQFGLDGEHTVTLWPEDERGLIDLSLLDAPVSGTLVYACGPPALLDAVEKRCSAWSAGSLQVERFAPKAPPSGQKNEAFTIELTRSGLTLEVPPEKSILEVCEQAGVSVIASCNEGTCGTCETFVVDGIPEHRDSVLSEAERADNSTLMVCVSRARSACLKLDL